MTSLLPNASEKNSSGKKGNNVRHQAWLNMFLFSFLFWSGCVALYFIAG